MTLFAWWLAVVLPLVAASGFVRATLKGANSLERTLATLAGAAVVILLVVLPLGLVGWLSPLPCLVFAGALALGGLVVGVRTEYDESRPLTMPPTEIVATVGIAVATGLVAVVFGRQLRGGTAFSFDDLTYHAAVVAHWVRDGAFSLTPFNYHAHYPFNAESFSLWFVLPTSGDGWAGTRRADVDGGCRAGSCGREQKDGSEPGASAAVAALSTATPAVIDQARTFSAVDLACSASIMAALSVFLVGGRKIPISHCAWVGAFAGYAAGCKPSFLPYPILFTVAAYLCRRRSPAASTSSRDGGTRRSGHRLVLVSAKPLSDGQPVVPCFRRAIRGPTRPGRTGENDGLVVDPLRRSRVAGVDRTRARSSQLADQHRSTGGGRILWAATAGRSSESGPPRIGLLLVLVVGLFSLAAYPFMPFTGAANAPDPPMRFDQRFLLLPLFVGLALSGALEKTKRWRSAWWAGAVLAAVTAWRGDGIDAGFALLGTGVPPRWRRRISGRPPRGEPLEPLD